MTTPQLAKKVVLCTGANRGLGYAILQVAALQEPSTNFILGSRSLESGREAADKLAKEGIKAHIDVIQIDITKDEQIIEAVKFVATTYGQLDGRFQFIDKPSKHHFGPTAHFFNVSLMQY